MKTFIALCLFPLKLVDVLDTSVINSKRDILLGINGKSSFMLTFITYDGENNILSNGTPSVIVEYP